MSIDAKKLAQRLNRHAPKNAQIRLVAEKPFGPQLTVRTWNLANGLRVHVVPDDSAPVAAFQTWLRVGSRDETPGKTGLAHFFEHLMFKGTPSHPQGELDKLLEGVGAETNAATWTDWTHYYETLPAAQLPLAITLEADRMQYLALDTEQLDSEREVVISERRDRVEDDVEGMTSEVLFRQAFREHPYGWPTIGWMADIESYTVEDCLRFYRQYYAPNNATVVVVGEVDEPILLGLIQEAYGGMRRSRIRRPARAAEPPQTRARRKRLRFPTHAEKVAIGLRSPGLGDPDWVPFAVLNDILFGGRSSRMIRRLVLQDELVTECWGALTPFGEPGLMEMGADLREGVTAERVETILWEEIGRLHREGVSERELLKSQSRLELGVLTSLETAGGKAEQIGFDDTVVGDPTASFARLDAYRAVTLDDLRHIAGTYLRRRSSTTVLVRPTAGSQR
ncbi:MAG: peptidase M16 [Sandaracinus sp.]|nr:peptidase M16 [Sandaracinus sp.]